MLGVFRSRKPRESSYSGTYGASLADKFPGTLTHDGKEYKLVFVSKYTGAKGVGFSFIFERQRRFLGPTQHIENAERLLYDAAKKQYVLKGTAWLSLWMDGVINPYDPPQYDFTNVGYTPADWLHSNQKRIEEFLDGDKIAPKRGEYSGKSLFG